LKKIILLTTAAVLFSPIAAKSNQKSSILVGIKASAERMIWNSAAENNQTEQNTVKDYEGENFWGGGAEFGYSYKVSGNWLFAGILGVAYSPEHEFAKDKSHPKTKAQVNLRPEIAAGYEFQLGHNASVTPFVGVGAEFAIYNENDSGDASLATKWKVPFAVGARVNVSYFYATLAGRFDLTATDLPTGSLANGKALKSRNGGLEISIGAEF